MAMSEDNELNELRRMFNTIESAEEGGNLEIDPSMINTNFSDEFDAEEFMDMPLPERFHVYMVREMCSEEDYQEAMRNNGYDYLPMLYRVKKEIPGEFYAYFHDLLHEKEHEYYYNKFLQSLNGIV